jgi:hypothetical protein
MKLQLGSPLIARNRLRDHRCLPSLKFATRLVPALASVIVSLGVGLLAKLDRESDFYNPFPLK